MRPIKETARSLLYGNGPHGIKVMIKKFIRLLRKKGILKDIPPEKIESRQDIINRVDKLLEHRRAMTQGDLLELNHFLIAKLTGQTHGTPKQYGGAWKGRVPDEQLETLYQVRPCMAPKGK